MHHSCTAYVGGGASVKYHRTSSRESDEQFHLIITAVIIIINVQLLFMQEAVILHVKSWP